MESCILLQCCLRISILQCGSGSGSSLYFDADPVDPDTAFDFDADPDPAFSLWYVSGSGFQNDTNPDSQHCRSGSVTFWHGSESVSLEPNTWFTNPALFVRDLIPRYQRQQKFLICLAYYFLRYIYISLQRKYVIRKSLYSRNQGFINFFASWWKDPDPYIVFTDPDPGGPKHRDPEHCWTALCQNVSDPTATTLDFS